MIAEYLKAFFVGAALCMIGQVLIDKTRLTPARILTLHPNVILITIEK